MIQIYDDLRKSDWQLIFKLTIVSPFPWSRNHNFGPWQPAHIYDVCSVLWIDDHDLQFSQQASDVQNLNDPTIDLMII